MNLGTRATATRFAVAAFVLGLYATGSAWIIRVEGEAHRKRLRDERLAARRELDPVPATTTGPTPSAEAPAAPKGHPAAPVARPEPPAPASTNPAERKSAPLPPAERTLAGPSGDAHPVAPAPPLDPFWELPEQKKVWDLDHLTVEDEKRLGADLHRMILRDHKRLTVGPLPERLEAAAEPYLASRARKEIPYTFTVLDCDESNVFSHPGGYIYACRGLFVWIAEEEDYALEFLVAHEIAHVDLAHALNCLRDPEVKKSGIGTVPLFHALAIPWGYKHEQDFEADRWAARRMRQAGRSRHETMAFLRKLEDFARKNGFENVPRKPTDDPGSVPLDNHLRAHPIPRARLKGLKALLDPPAKPS